jgi:hypothetical protein
MDLSLPLKVLEVINNKKSCFLDPLVRVEVTDFYGIRQKTGLKHSD